MIRIAGTAALGLMLNACPFGASEPPDGHARVVGQVLMRDGSTYTRTVQVGCWSPSEFESGLMVFNQRRVHRQGSYSVLLRAPYRSRPEAPEPFEFPCRVMAGPRGAAFAVRYVTVRFSGERGDPPVTRVDLREGEIELAP